jgi:hypothetical protein
MKRESKILLEKATDSLLLSIESFNSPRNRGRNESVLISLDRAFELFLKSIIIFKGGKIRESKSKQTIGFDNCVRKCVSDSRLKCLTEEQALTIQIINSLRDAAQHYIIDISEQQLYIYCQSGVTLFSDLLKNVFGLKLTDFMPDRVLPISANPPQTLSNLMDIEFYDIKDLVKSGKRRKLEAAAKLRSFAIVEASLNGVKTQPSDFDLENIINKINKGESWNYIFPAIKEIMIDNEGAGFALSLKITKNEGEPVHLVPEGTPGATVIAVKRVNELDYYTLGLAQIATKIKMSMPIALSIIIELKIQDDVECFKMVKIGKACFKRYSPIALDKLLKNIPKLNVQDIWEKNRPKTKKRKND